MRINLSLKVRSLCALGGAQYEKVEENKLCSHVPLSSTFIWKLIKIVYYIQFLYTANEEPVRIQYKCLVLIYEFLEMKLRSLIIFKTEL
jgi:hypothetical protein